MKIPTIVDSRGVLTVVEFSSLPWHPKRAYFLSHSNISLSRGQHAHKKLEQVLFSISGDWDLRLFDGIHWSTVTLKSGEGGLLLTAGIWREVSTSDPTAVLCVLASESFTESDYIRDLEEYKRWRSS